MKILKAGTLQQAGVVSYDRAALEDFPQFPAEVEVVLEETVEEEVIDIEALRAEVLDQARLEAAALVQQAYQEGLRRGEDSGRQAFEQRIAGVAELLEAAAQDMQRARNEFIDSLEPQVLELVMLAARRTLQREIATDPDLLHNTLRRALALLSDRQRILVHLNPADAETLREQKVRLLEEFRGVEEVEIVTDDSVAPGSCVIDSQTMKADARLDALLEDVLAQLWS